MKKRLICGLVLALLLGTALYTFWTDYSSCNEVDYLGAVCGDEWTSADMTAGDAYSAMTEYCGKRNDLDGMYFDIDQCATLYGLWNPTAYVSCENMFNVNNAWAESDSDLGAEDYAFAVDSLWDGQDDHDADDHDAAIAHYHDAVTWGEESQSHHADAIAHTQWRAWYLGQMIYELKCPCQHDLPEWYEDPN